MSPPFLNVYQQGMGVVPADGLNTFEQVCPNISFLRGFVPVSNMQAFVQGFETPGDGGAGPFWWNATAVSTSFTDDGMNTIVPNGVTSGVWSRLGYLETPTPYSYQVPLTGFSIAIPTGVSSLILNPAGALASGAVTLPVPLRDGWILRVSSSQAVTSVTFGAQAGQSVNNAPTAFTAGVPVGFQYVAAALTWFRI